MTDTPLHYQRNPHRMPVSALQLKFILGQVSEIHRLTNLPVLNDLTKVEGLTRAEADTLISTLRLIQSAIERKRSHEHVYACERDAMNARRKLINEGHEVSLVAYDTTRGLYVFDVLDQS